MTDVLKKIGDKASSVVSSLKSLPPNDGEAQTLAENQKQVETMSAKTPKTAPPEYEPSEQDKVAPLARYGSRPGEKRLDTSYTEQPTAIKAPIYDKGGDVSMEASKRLQSSGDAGIQGFLNEPDEQPLAPLGKSAKQAGPTLTGEVADYRNQKAADKYGRLTTADPNSISIGNGTMPGGPSPVAPSMQQAGIVAAPIADSGGDAPIDVNDGKHQVAILQDGEKVLTPPEAEQYRKEHGEKGAPAGFSGQVLPNPKGLKAIDSDNPEPKPADTDHLPKGVSVKTDNAPLKTPDGDISNPLPADVQPEQGREVSTQTLKPYSQVVEERAKAKAAEQVSNPNASGQPSTSGVEGNIPEEKPKEEKPKVTYGHILADQWLQKNGMPSMDSFMAPKGLGLNDGSQQGGAAPQGNATPAPQGGMRPIVQPDAATPPPPPQGKEVFKAKIAGYDKQYQDLMDKAAQTNDPQYTEQAARVKEAKLEYEKAHPWGSKESAHPGVLGKIGHVAEQVLSRAPVSAPIMKIIPGTEGYRAGEQAAAQEQEKQASAENAAENKASTVKAATAPATAQQIQDYQERIANSGLTGQALQTYGKAPAGSTVAELDKRFDEATKLRGMNQKDADTAVAEQDRKDKAEEMEFEHNQTRQDRLAKAYYTYTTTDPKTGKKTTQVTTGDKLDEIPEDAQLLPVKDMTSLMGEARSMNAVQDSMNEIHKDIHDHPEVFDNATARGIIQTTTEQMNRVAATMLVAGTGGSLPLPSGLGDIINTALQNNALDDKTAKAVKNYIADYKAMKDKAMVIQMAMQNGKMGRGGQQAFESIVNQLPGGSTPDGATALRQMSSLQRTLSGLNSKYPDKYADYTKTEPYALEEAAPEGTAAAESKNKTAPKAAPKAATGGYSPNNPFAPKPQQP